MADKKDKGGRLRTVVTISNLINNNRRVSIKRIAAETGLSERSARRWARTFADCCDLRIESGVVIVDD